jgi:hypothetical protein
MRIRPSGSHPGPLSSVDCRSGSREGENSSMSGVTAGFCFRSPAIQATAFPGDRTVCFRSFSERNCPQFGILPGGHGASDNRHLDAAKALSSSPAALDLFMWISYRCFTAKGEERAKAEKAGQFVAFTERMARSKTTEHIEWPPFRTRPGRAAGPAILSGPWAKSRSDACGVTPSVSGRLRTGPDRHLPPASRQSRARVRRPRFGQTC